MADKFDIDRGLSEFFDEALNEPTLPGELFSEIQSCKERYADESELGVGGMKKIIKVRDEMTGREVAKAVLKKEANTRSVERFLREARINASLEHPNIIPVHDLGIDENGEAFFTMKIIRGKHLKLLLQEIKEGKLKIDLSDLLDMFVKICDAVAYAHANNIIHLDLKPENIQISSFGEVLLCDWGLARDLNEQIELVSATEVTERFITQDGVVRGTPGYMSPEQAEGKLSQTGPHSDIYSLGAILYSLLTLESPGKGTVDEVLQMTRQGDIIAPIELKPDKQISQALQAVCQKAMALQAEQRYADVEALKKDIVSYLHGFATSAEEASFSAQFKLLIKRNRRVSILMALFSLIVIIGSSYFLVSLKERELQARLAEGEARNNLQKFKTEEAIKHRLTKDAAPRILERVAEALNTYKFDEGMELVRFAIDLDYNLMQAHSRKGYFHLSLFEFEESQKEFKICKFPDNHKTIIACRQLIEKFGKRKILSVDEIIWIAQLYHKLSKKQMINENTFSPRLDHLSLQERRQYAIAVMKLQNPDLNEIRFEGDKILLDWTKLKDINGLYKTGITELDMSKSPIKCNVIAIKGLPLRKLVWPHSAPGTYFDYIHRCKTLEEIHLPKKYTDEKVLKRVPSGVKVILY